MKLLYIEPKNPPSSEPVLDDITGKVTAAWRYRSFSDISFRGFHTHVCGGKNINSDNRDHPIPGGLLTNSLAIHYIAFHRDEVPESDIALIEMIELLPEIPTKKELNGRLFD